MKSQLVYTLDFDQITMKNLPQVGGKNASLGELFNALKPKGIENLVGCHMHNADQLVPEWQDLKVGDEVWLHPKAPPLKVLAIEPGRAIVLENSWTFFLHRVDDHTTRLIIRGRGRFNPDLKNALLNFILWRGVFEPAHFIMERKMMVGIKERAEENVTTPKESKAEALIAQNDRVGQVRVGLRANM